MRSGRDSMMLLQALQNFNPRLPTGGSDPEPQASIYATKSADEGALDAWKANLGAHDAAAGRGMKERISGAELRSLGARNDADNAARLMAELLQADARKADVGARSKLEQDRLQVDRDRLAAEQKKWGDENARRQAADADQAAYRKRMADIAAQRAGRGGASGAKGPDAKQADKALNDTIRNLQAQLSVALRPDPIRGAVPEENVAKAEAIRKQITELHGLRQQLQRSAWSGDSSGVGSILSRAQRMFSPTPLQQSSEAIRATGALSSGQGPWSPDALDYAAAEAEGVTLDDIRAARAAAMAELNGGQ